MGLYLREVLPPLSVLDALGDLVGDVAGVRVRLGVLAALEFTGAGRQEGAGGSLAAGAGALLEGFVDRDRAASVVAVLPASI